jgi:SAM-dependent methyltransferase
MEKVSPFDIPWAQNFAKLRKAFIVEFLGPIRQHLELESALDVGCGVGYFSKFLSDLAFHVIAVDGREENIREAKRRFPDIKFLTADVENLPLEELGTFDFVLCAGLLYHLENPFRAIRNLYRLTAKVLLIEGMCTPGLHPTMDLLDEGVSENQGLNYVAFYPTESCLVKMLYRAGFPFVYLFERMPADELFTATVWRKRQRTIMVASKVALSAPNLVFVKEPIRPTSGISDPWTTELSRSWHLLARLRSLFLKPLRRLRANSRAN